LHKQNFPAVYLPELCRQLHTQKSKWFHDRAQKNRIQYNTKVVLKMYLIERGVVIWRCTVITAVNILCLTIKASSDSIQIYYQLMHIIKNIHSLHFKKLHVKMSVIHIKNKD
jgi:hypothetical protein